MFGFFGQTVKKDDGNDPWDGIRRNMGTGRVKSCVVTKLNYMKKSKQAYVFFSLEIERRNSTKLDGTIILYATLKVNNKSVIVIHLGSRTLRSLTLPYD